MAENVSVWRSEWSNIRALESQLDEQRAQAQATQHRLASQLNKLQGDLSDRVDRLTASFDAFVELSEIRDQLGLYVDARRWRIAARQLVESSLRRGPAPADGGAEGLPDVAGYWLAAAVRALPDLMERGSAATDLAESQRRDARRTATFIACVAGLLGSPAIADAHIATVFGGDAARLDVAQLAIWGTADAGVLSPAARTAVHHALSRRVQALGADARDGIVTRLADRAPGRIAPAGGRRTTQPAQMSAATRLEGWSAWLAGAGAATAAADPDRSPGPENGQADALLTVVRSLVEEGSEPERALLDRADALRLVMDAGTTSPAPGWDDDAGDVGELLTQALLDGSPSVRTVLAADLLSAEISAAADRLFEQASVAPPDTVEVRSAGRELVVTASGADPARLAALDAEALRATPSGAFGPRTIGAIGAIGATVFALCAVLGIAVAPGWFAVAVLAAAGAAVWAFAVQRAASASAADRRSAVEATRRLVDDTARQLVADAARAQVAQVEAANAHAAIRARLAR